MFSVDHHAGPDGIVDIRFEHAPVNALNAEMLAALVDILARVETDTSLRVVTLTGIGRHFCAGADVSSPGAVGGFATLLGAIDALRIPVIAAINGGCIGGGLELALACDIRLATPSARFVCAGVNMGLTASAMRLPRLIGLSHASHALLTGLPIDALKAERIGLVETVVEEGMLDEAAKELAHRIATRAPLSVEATRKIARRSHSLSDADLRAMQGEAIATLRETSDHAEAVRALRNRREPRFTRS